MELYSGVFGDVEFSEPHCRIEVHHPCTLMPLRRAPLAKGVYFIQGDVRPLFRQIRDRRMMVAGLFTVEFDPGEKVSARTLFAAAAPPPPAVVADPPPLDLRAHVVYNRSEDVAPPAEMVQVEVTTTVAVAPPVIVGVAPELELGRVESEVHPPASPVELKPQIMDLPKAPELSYDDEIFVIQDDAPEVPRKRRRMKSSSV